jgi:hypothetical protein
MVFCLTPELNKTYSQNKPFFVKFQNTTKNKIKQFKILSDNI